MPDTPASTSTRPRSPTRTRTSSARGSSPARASTTSTPSWPRWRAASPRTRSSRTTCSKGSTRGPRSSRTSRWSTTFPSSVLAHAGRQRRWVRGDWQIPRVALPVGADRRGLERNRLPLIARWKILDNLRRSLVPPGTLALLISAWTWLPGSTWAWTLAVYLGMAFPIYSKIARGLKGPTPQQPVAVFLRDLREELNTAVAQVLLDLTLLAYHSYEMVHAIGVTLVRLFITQRKLLEWETAATAAARSRQALGTERHQGVRERHVDGAGRCGAISGLALTTRPEALLVALPPLLPLARLADGRLLAEPAGAAAPGRARAQGPGLPAPHRAEHVALLRDVQRRAGPLASARQRPGEAGAEGGAPDVADERRDVAPRHALRPRSRVHRGQGSAGPRRAGDEHARRTGAARGAPS